MQQHGSKYFSRRPPPTPDPGVKRSKLTLQNVVILHIKLKGATNVAMPADPPSHLTLGRGSKVQNSTFSEHGLDAYQIKGNHECSNIVATIFARRPPSDPGDWVKKSKYFRTWSCCMHMKLKGITNVAKW